MFNEFIKQLKKLHKQNVEYLDPKIQHFNVGDLAWVSWNRYIQEQVKITSIESYKKEPNDGGYIYYYYEHLDITKWDRIKMYLRFYLNVYFLMYIFKNRPYFPPKKFGVGHGVLAGRGEVLFKTEKEAELDYRFTIAIFELEDLKYLFNKMEK